MIARMKKKCVTTVIRYRVGKNETKTTKNEQWNQRPKYDEDKRRRKNWINIQKKKSVPRKLTEQRMIETEACRHKNSVYN